MQRASYSFTIPLGQCGRNGMKEETTMFDKVKSAAGNLDISKYQDLLQGIKFPCSKDELITQLKQKGSDPQVIDAVKNAGREQFGSVSDVMGALK